MKRKTDALEKSGKKLVGETVAAIMVSSTFTEAAKLLNLGLSGLYDRMARYPEIRDAVDQMPQLALARLKAGANRAAEKLVAGIDDEKEGYTNSKYILDKVIKNDGPDGEEFTMTWRKKS